MSQASGSQKIKLQYVPLVIAGITSWLYMIGGPSFAETHLTFSFLNFPVFIGEIVLAVCLPLTVLVMLIRRDRLHRFDFFVLAYFAFVLIKAWVGYQRYGPLACRHAALFYYPFFAVVGSRCSDEKFFKNTLVKLAIVALVFLAFYLDVHSYFAFPLTLLVFGAIVSIPHPTWRILIFVVMLVLLPYKTYFADGRSRIVGNAVALTSLVGIYVAAFIRMRKRMKAAVIVVFFGLLCALVVRVADKNAIRSLTSWDVMKEKWVKYSGRIEAEYDQYEFKSVEPRIFNQNLPGDRSLREGIRESFRPEETSSVGQSASLRGEGRLDGQNDETSREEPVVNPPPTPAAVKLRSLEAAQNNILFRIFIWRDVWRDMLAKRCFLLGADFGFPFRSRGLEILGWANDAWGIDGWVAVHNSYLDMIYRGGMFGIGLVGYLVFTLLRLIRLSVRDKRRTYIFVVSTFICFMTYANFIEFFEMPYTAIPFWTLWGCCLGISRKKL